MPLVQVKVLAPSVAQVGSAVTTSLHEVQTAEDEDWPPPELPLTPPTPPEEDKPTLEELPPPLLLPPEEDEPTLEELPPEEDELPDEDVPELLMPEEDELPDEDMPELLLWVLLLGSPPGEGSSPEQPNVIDIASARPAVNKGRTLCDPAMEVSVLIVYILLLEKVK